MAVTQDAREWVREHDRNVWHRYQNGHYAPAVCGHRPIPGSPYCSQERPANACEACRAEKRIDGIPELEWLRQRVEVLEAELGRMKYLFPPAAEIETGLFGSRIVSPQQWYTTYGD